MLSSSSPSSISSSSATPNEEKRQIVLSYPWVTYPEQSSTREGDAASNVKPVLYSSSSSESVFGDVEVCRE